MQSIIRGTLGLALVLGSSGAFSVRAGAFELNGAWTTGTDHCRSVFTTRGRAAEAAIASFSDARGFIIDGNQIRGKISKCTIKSKREDGQLIDIIAACGADVVLSKVQFTFKVLDDKSILRVFGGPQTEDVHLFRCDRP